MQRTIQALSALATMVGVLATVTPPSAVAGPTGPTIQLNLTYDECEFVLDPGAVEPRGEEKAPTDKPDAGEVVQGLKQPTKAKEHVTRSLQHAYAGQGRLAIQEMDQAIALEPVWRLHLMKAMVVQIANHRAPAGAPGEEALQKELGLAVEKAPKDKTALVHAVAGVIVSPQYEGAIAWLDRAVELDPKNTVYLLLRAGMHDHAGEYKKAARDALNTGPDTVMGWYLYCDATLKSGDLKLAIESYRQALRKHPESHGLAYKCAHSLVGMPNQRKDQYIMAIAAARRSCELTQDQHEYSVTLLGDAYRLSGDVESAIEMYQKLVELDGASVERAEQVLGSLQERLPMTSHQRTISLMTSGLAYMVLDDVDSAVDAFEKAEAEAAGDSDEDRNTIRACLAKLRSKQR